MGQSIVSIANYKEHKESVREVIQNCDGLSNLKSDNKVLIKPNLVFWDRVYPFPKYGVLTTNVLVKEIVKILKEHGCEDITIGEGSMELKELGSSTEEAFRGLGYYKLAEKYGVKLKDFNEGTFTEVELGEKGNSIELNISDDVLDADFIINLPVLKTHNSTFVSLGFKNLKGCIDTSSKMFCHHESIALDNFISYLGDKIAPDLTIIDGIYSLEKGPFINGKAYRSNLLIASKDNFAADVIGSKILGFNPEDILHLKDYATKNNREFDGIEVDGEDVDSIKMSLKWDWSWLEDNSGPPAFEKLGMEEIYYPKYDNTLCSGCSFLNNAMLVLLMDAYQKKSFKNMEFISGKKMIASGNYDKTFLMGKCAIHLNKNNSDIKEAVKLTGCPPRLSKIIEKFNEHGIDAREKAYYDYRKSLAKRYEGDEEFDEGHFKMEG